MWFTLSDSRLYPFAVVGKSGKNSWSIGGSHLDTVTESQPFQGCCIRDFFWSQSPQYLAWQGGEICSHADQLLLICGQTSLRHPVIAALWQDKPYSYDASRLHSADKILAGNGINVC